MPEADTSLSDDLATLRALAVDAGALAMSFKDDGRETRAWKKSGGSPVTEADVAVNTLCQQRLSAARGDYGWLSEETADDPAKRQTSRCWVVDPIDGTRAYMRDDPNWCIGLAVVESGHAVAGVIYAPEHGAMYEARRGGGAYRNGASIAVSECGSEAGCRLIAAQQMVAHKSWPEPWPEVVLAAPKPNATLLRMAFVADGSWDAAVVLGRKSDWDIAAGAIIVSEAGGLATTHLNEAFRFNREIPAQRSVIAAGKGLHPLLVQRSGIVTIADPQDPAGSPNPVIKTESTGHERRPK